MKNKISSFSNIQIIKEIENIVGWNGDIITIEMLEFLEGLIYEGKTRNIEIFIEDIRNALIINQKNYNPPLHLSKKKQQIIRKTERLIKNLE